MPVLLVGHVENSCILFAHPKYSNYCSNGVGQAGYLYPQSWFSLFVITHLHAPIPLVPLGLVTFVPVLYHKMVLLVETQYHPFRNDHFLSKMIFSFGYQSLQDLFMLLLPVPWYCIIISWLYLNT